jgi:hypothetical protein
MEETCTTRLLLALLRCRCHLAANEKSSLKLQSATCNLQRMHVCTDLETSRSHVTISYGFWGSLCAGGGPHLQYWSMPRVRSEHCTCLPILLVKRLVTERVTRSSFAHLALSSARYCARQPSAHPFRTNEPKRDSNPRDYLSRIRQVLSWGLRVSPQIRTEAGHWRKRFSPPHHADPPGPLFCDSAGPFACICIGRL